MTISEIDVVVIASAYYSVVVGVLNCFSVYEKALNCNLVVAIASVGYQVLFPSIDYSVIEIELTGYAVVVGGRLGIAILVNFEISAVNSLFVIRCCLI